MAHQRPGLDDYFMEIALVVAKRSTCLRRQVGAVIVKGKQIVSTGYNGAPAGHVHCADIGCARANVPSGRARRFACAPRPNRTPSTCRTVWLPIADPRSTLHTTVFWCPRASSTPVLRRWSSERTIPIRWRRTSCLSSRCASTTQPANRGKPRPPLQQQHLRGRSPLRSITAPPAVVRRLP